MRAAVFQDGKLDVVEGVDVRGPRADEVLVRIGAAGLCHSDLSVVNGTIPFPGPAVLGHEGAGVVEDVGAAVTRVRAGDHVCLTTINHCGVCPACSAGHPTMCRSTFGRMSRPFTRTGADGAVEKVASFANTSVFTERVVVKEVQAVPIPQDVPMASAALIGCGVLTGVGAVLNRAKVQIGETVVVIGVGGIGLNAIQGARIARAGRIVAVDTNPRKEEVARRFGATDFVDPSGQDVVAQVSELLPHGADYVFECVGHPALIRAATDMLGWSGTAVLLGVPRSDAEASFLVSGMYMDKTIMGCRYGTSHPQFDVMRYVDLYRTGELLLDELVTKTYPLEHIHEAIHDLESGSLARGVLLP
ncbi:MAG: Zn-dependent alcohol dehydrogenase [Catenulispora sp.]|nr:Zn-dependent alcohol dehydrogenase [Catenulispora sp.]